MIDRAVPLHVVCFGEVEPFCGHELWRDGAAGQNMPADPRSSNDEAYLPAKQSP